MICFILFFLCFLVLYFFLFSFILCYFIRFVYEFIFFHIGSETEVFRDQFYDGHLKAENCAVVARLSPSFMRFGSFEIFFHRKEYEHIKTLADYVIDTHFPHILSHERQLCQQQRQQSQQQQNAESLAETTELPACDRKEAGTNSYRYRAWFRGVVERTAKLIAKWQSIGFGNRFSLSLSLPLSLPPIYSLSLSALALFSAISHAYTTQHVNKPLLTFNLFAAHGVLNTDNMSILGLTIGTKLYARS